MIHKMSLQNKPFEKIKFKEKTIEMRLLDEKRRKINIGDIIIFTNVISNEIIKVEVLNLHTFSTFEKLYEKFDKIKLGYEKDEIANPSDMSQYYDEEKINKNGVLGIEIKLIEN